MKSGNIASRSDAIIPVLPRYIRMKERNANNKSDKMRPKLSSGIFVAALLLCAAMPAIANDGTYYTKGNQLVPLMETDISVRKEILTISLLTSSHFVPSNSAE